MQLSASNAKGLGRRAISSDRVILLFTRAPSEEAKAKGLPSGSGSRLFAAFIGRWRERASEAGAELIAVTPAASASSLRALLPDTRILLQSGASFGEQLESAFQAAFASAAKAVVTVPGDCPPLAVESLERAFRHLESDGRAMAMMPSEDGGVNLLGFSPSARRDLPGVCWFGPGVCVALRGQAACFGLPLLEAGSSADVDHIADVRAIYLRSLADPAWRPFRELLASLLLRAAYPETSFPAVRPAWFLQAFFERGPPPLFA